MAKRKFQRGSGKFQGLLETTLVRRERLKIDSNQPRKERFRRAKGLNEMLQYKLHCTHTSPVLRCTYTSISSGCPGLLVLECPPAQSTTVFIAASFSSSLFILHIIGEIRFVANCSCCPSSATSLTGKKPLFSFVAPLVARSTTTLVSSRENKARKTKNPLSHSFPRPVSPSSTHQLQALTNEY